MVNESDKETIYKFVVKKKIFGKGCVLWYFRKEEQRVVPFEKAMVQK